MQLFCKKSKVILRDIELYYNPEKKIYDQSGIRNNRWKISARKGEIPE